MQAGAVWLLADNISNPTTPPAGFTDLGSMINFFAHFNGANPSYSGAVLWNTSSYFVLASPLFGCLTSNGRTPVVGWLYMPVSALYLARHTLALYVPAAPLGPNIGPLLTMPQIAQFQVQYVAISLNTALQLPSTHSGVLSMAGSKGLGPVI
jgi:hypothetical protein